MIRPSTFRAPGTPTSKRFSKPATGLVVAGRTASLPHLGQ